MNEQQNYAETIANLASAVGLPQIAADGGNIPYAVVPDGYTLESLERFLPAPSRKRGTATLRDAASFSAYVQAFREPSVRLFADYDNYGVTAFLEYHSETDAAVVPLWGPSWCEHTAALALKHSPEWEAWTRISGRPMAQVAFAEFLEDHLQDIAHPAAATLLQLAQNLEAKRSVAFKSGVNLTDGTIALAYEEKAESKPGGKVQVPAKFTLGIAPFKHGKLYKVEARLRYRIDKDSALSFIVVLSDLERISDAAFGDIVAGIEETTGLTALIGNASIPKP